MSDGARGETFDRVTVSMPSSTLKQLRAAVQAGAASSVSALVSEAVAARLSRDEGLRRIAALRAQQGLGPLPEEALAWARKALGVENPPDGPERSVQ